MQTVTDALNSRVARVCALVAYCAVVIALTLLKSFYRIGYLWDPANQSRRGLSLIPFSDLIHARSIFGPVFGYGGNIAFFIPVGVLAFVLWRNVSRAVVFGAVFSVLMEVSQFLFALGLTDIDDLLMNTLGAVIGAVFARWAGPRWFPVWVALSIAVTVVFAGLVLAGERLGDPAQVREVY